MAKIEDRIREQADIIGTQFSSDLLGVVQAWANEQGLTPIEQLFGLELLNECLLRRMRGSGVFWFSCQWGIRAAAGAKYRVDFAVFGPGKDDPVLFVELDGHEFHEKTREQVERDKKRERVIVATGVPVLRFSGREVWRDPYSCVREVLDFYQKAIDPKDPKTNG